MRISDWSSDVCSSDLHAEAKAKYQHIARCGPGAAFCVQGGEQAEPYRHDSGSDDRENAVTADPRSEARRVGKECVSTCRSRRKPSHSQQNNNVANHPVRGKRKTM